MSLPRPSLSGRLALVASALALATSACAPEPWDEDGAVVSRTIHVKTRGIELEEITLVAPSGGRGPSHGLRRGLVLSPGGLVDPHRYLPLAKAFASRGWVVAIPSFPGGLGFFAPDNAVVAADVLLKGDRANFIDPLAYDIVHAGHSLGGVVAAAAATHGTNGVPVDAPGVGTVALVLFASQANGSDPVENLSIPVLSVAGAADCSFSLDTAKAEFKRFPASTSLFASLADVPHYAFTDKVDEDEARGCKPDGMPGLRTLHARIAELVHLFVRSRVDGDFEATQALADGLPGVTFGAN